MGRMSTACDSRGLMIQTSGLVSPGLLWRRVEHLFSEQRNLVNHSCRSSAIGDGTPQARKSSRKRLCNLTRRPPARNTSPACVRHRIRATCMGHCQLCGIASNVGRGCRPMLRGTELGRRGSSRARGEIRRHTVCPAIASRRSHQRASLSNRMVARLGRLGQHRPLPKVRQT